MSNNTTILLTAAAFALIGFAVGRVTAPPPLPIGMQEFKMMECFSGGEASDDEVQIIVKKLESSDFEGDTVFAIPGGQVWMQRNGEEVKVEVEMNEEGTNLEVRDSTSSMVVKKRVVVTSED